MPVVGGRALYRASHRCRRLGVRYPVQSLERLRCGPQVSRDRDHCTSQPSFALRGEERHLQLRIRLWPESELRKVKFDNVGTTAGTTSTMEMCIGVVLVIRPV